MALNLINMRQKCPNCKIYKSLNKNGKCKQCNYQQGLKQCSKCSEIQLLHLAFYSKNHPCKKCIVKYEKTRKDEILAYQESYREENREKAIETSRRWRKENAHLAFVNRIKREYNLTFESYSQMLQDQKGVCAICYKPDPKQRLSIDHDHTTGTVRGLLCSYCNTLIGMAKDSSEILTSAIQYLLSRKMTFHTGHS